ncbi:heat shock protein beta-11-like [Thamnophis elegans]|uniref:heat shock protein beta-11-like n=1 Tax=Thamnophis elegans TaxID=35005 RepID=UPI001377CB96|nr:heat shock protein beta-11-like [Thamnophis elegans]
MASQGYRRRQPLLILQEPQLSSFGRQPDGEAQRWVVGGAPSLLRQLTDHLNERERLWLLALEEPECGSTGRTQPLSLRGRSWHQLALDVEGFSAEELMVKLEGRKLTVLGKQEKEEVAERGCVCRESRQLRKELLLPPDADLEALTCALHPDGQLRVQVPRLERTIPITVERSPSETDGGANDPPAGGETSDGADGQ